jgi:hypothetical protein
MHRTRKKWLSGFAHPRSVEVMSISFEQERLGFAVGTNELSQAEMIYVIVTRKNGKCRLATETEVKARQKEISDRTQNSTVP